MLRILTAIIVVYLLYVVTVFVLQRHMIYPGSGYPFEPPTPPDHVERWEHEIAGGTVHAYFSPAAQPNSPGVVLLHGNLQCAEHLFGMLNTYRARGFSVLVPEYRGYAGAAGKPSEDGIAADVATMVARFADHRSVDAAKIAYHGLSLGGAIAASTARRRAPQALVLQSTFTSARDMAHDVHVPGFIALDPYDTRGLLLETKLPVLLVHGEDDPVIEVSHAHANKAAAPDAELALFPGEHGIPLPGSHERYWSTVLDFLGRHGLEAL